MTRNNFSETLNSVFECSEDKFKPCAVYHTAMDFAEYITVDETTVSKRIDEYLTLIYNLKMDKLVGFRFKGFRYIFQEQLKEVYALQEKDFLSFVSIIEILVKSIGDELLNSEERKKAYKAAYKLAKTPDCPELDLSNVAESRRMHAHFGL